MADDQRTTPATQPEPAMDRKTHDGTAAEFYERIVKRPDVREILKRLAQ